MNGSAGFVNLPITDSRTIEYSFDMPVQLVSPHPLSGQDNLSVTRGPIVYVAEAIDNPQIESQYPHFGGVGLHHHAKFSGKSIDIDGLPVISLETQPDHVYGNPSVKENAMYDSNVHDKRQRDWKKIGQKLVLVPWFARANRGGNGHVRIAMHRVGREVE